MNVADQGKMWANLVALGRCWSAKKNEANLGKMSLKVVGDECFLPFNGLIFTKLYFTFNIIHHFNFTIDLVINIFLPHRLSVLLVF